MKREREKERERERERERRLSRHPIKAASLLSMTGYRRNILVSIIFHR